MDEFIELLKTLGTVIGIVLGAWALIYQRRTELRKAQAESELAEVHQEVDLSTDARLWATEFREQLAVMTARVDALTVANVRLHAEVNALRQSNSKLQTALELLKCENEKLRKEVVILRDENGKLRGCIDQQEHQISELQDSSTRREADQ